MVIVLAPTVFFVSCRLQVVGSLQVGCTGPPLLPPAPVVRAAREEAEGEERDGRGQSMTEEEARVEAFESRLKAGKKTTPSPSSSAQGKRAMNVTAAAGGRAEWKKGKLFPEGWEDMNPLQKATELYLGERGFLYWSSQLAIGGTVVLVVAWVFFRFIGPSVGLYQLSNDINTPNF